MRRRVDNEALSARNSCVKPTGGVGIPELPDKELSEVISSSVLYKLRWRMRLPGGGKVKEVVANGDCRRKSPEDMAFGASRLGLRKRRLMVSSIWPAVELEAEGFGRANSDDEAANVCLSTACIVTSGLPCVV